jgi:alpha-L-fucosidase
VLRNVEVPTTVQVTMLGVPGTLRHRTDGNTLTLELPALGPDEAPCRYAYTFKITGAKVLPERAK